MKIFFCVVVLLSFYLMSQGQNVGINKSSPSQPLDVNGNLNVDGKIMVNNTAGIAGQVLTTNLAGATTWASVCDFKYEVNFTQNSTFTVPANVTRIMVEAWGAGGGGSSGGGGAGGMYIRSVQNVAPGAVLTITVGTGGANATTFGGAASDGTNTAVSGTTVSLNAVGGRGAFTATPGFASYFGTSGSPFMQYMGQNGAANTESYQQKNSTTFVIVRKYGDGGATGPDYNTRSQGQTRILNENSGVVIFDNITTFAPVPGGGGGGGILGRDGAVGMVLIRY